MYLFVFEDDATVVGDEEIQQFRAQLVLGRAMNEPNGCGIIVCLYSIPFSYKLIVLKMKLQF